MAWTSGHTKSCSTTVPATTDGSLTEYTMMLSHLDFGASDRIAIATFLDNGQYEASLSSTGETILGCLATDINTSTGVFRVWVKYDTSSSASTTIYWRFGAAVSHSAGDQVDSNTHLVALLSEDFLDYSGNGNNGTAINGLTTGGLTGPDGVFGSPDFNGSSHGIDITDNETFTIGAAGNFTLSAWVQTTQVSNGLILDHNDISQNRLIYTTSTGVFRAQANGVNHDSSPTVINDGSWHHVAFVRDFSSSRRYIYVDGVETRNVPETAAAAVNPGTNVQIGRRINGSIFFNGGIVNVVSTSSARSIAWVKTDHDRQGTLGQASSTALLDYPPADSGDPGDSGDSGGSPASGVAVLSGYALHWLLEDLGNGYFSLNTSSEKAISNVKYNIGGISFSITTDGESYASEDYTNLFAADEAIEFFIGGHALTAFRYGGVYKIATIASSVVPDDEQEFFIKGNKARAYRVGSRWYLVV